MRGLPERFALMLEIKAKSSELEGAWKLFQERLPAEFGLPAMVGGMGARFTAMNRKIRRVHGSLIYDVAAMPKTKTGEGKTE